MTTTHNSPPAYLPCSITTLFVSSISKSKLEFENRPHNARQFKLLSGRDSSIWILGFCGLRPRITPGRIKQRTVWFTHTTASPPTSLSLTRPRDMYGYFLLHQKNLLPLSSKPFWPSTVTPMAVVSVPTKGENLLRVQSFGISSYMNVITPLNLPAPIVPPRMGLQKSTMTSLLFDPGHSYTDPVFPPSFGRRHFSTQSISIITLFIGRQRKHHSRDILAANRICHRLNCLALGYA